MRIIYADGIGSAHHAAGDERSILWATVGHLAQLRGAEAHRVEWPASMAGVGGRLSWEQAAAIGVKDLDRLMAEHPTDSVVLLGYSGGAKVVHDWLDTRPRMLDRVAAVGFLSDPFRPEGKDQHGTPPSPGWGICGPREGPLPGRTFWASWPGDVITACPPDSPLRTLADLSDRIPGGFLDDFGQHLRLNDWQLANHIRLWLRDPLAYLRGLHGRFRAARAGVEGYLGVEHTRAYTRPWGPQDDQRSYAVRLADTINYGLGVRGYGRGQG